MCFFFCGFHYYVWHLIQYSTRSPTCDIAPCPTRHKGSNRWRRTRGRGWSRWTCGWGHLASQVPEEDKKTISLFSCVNVLIDSDVWVHVNILKSPGKSIWEPRCQWWGNVGMKWRHSATSSSAGDSDTPSRGSRIGWGSWRPRRSGTPWLSPSCSHSCPLEVSCHQSPLLPWCWSLVLENHNF